MIKTFKAKIIGSVVRSEGIQPPIDITIKFNKYRVLLDEKQINRISLDAPYDKFMLSDKMDYTFDKKVNKVDKKQFSVLLFDSYYHLKISNIDKIKANIIHGRYWLYREREWFLKTLVAAAIGFLFAITGQRIGYRQGHQDGLKEGITHPQDTIPK